MENQLTIQKIIDFNERIIPKSLFDSIITSTTLPPKALEERNSEIWNYSYLGYGKVTLKSGRIYEGVRFEKGGTQNLFNKCFPNFY